MRLHRFFVQQEIGDQDSVVIRDSDFFHQIKNVFRFTTGGQIILFDNSGYEYHTLIASLEKGEVNCSIVSRKTSKGEPARELHLFCSIIKKDKFEWILEKGTELGVSRFVPLLSDRSEKKDLNMERAQKILIESAEQSGRTMVPMIAPIMNFEGALATDFPCFAFHPKADVFTVEHAGKISPLGIFIGPEGGWTERELFLFKKHNIKIYSLGAQVLRAETAAVAITSLILLQ
jgi:16S rRNA (uracil1498-N3)-methyltransferase